MKKVFTSASVLVIFDQRLHVIVSADASSYGLGCVLMNAHKDG